jgi:hypothetical protein
MPGSDSHRRPEVSQDAHSERVKQARKLAFDAGKDIDDALAENVGNPQLRRARADAMLDRVFPGMTQEDYDTYDAAEAALLHSRTRGYTTVHGQEYDELSQKEKSAINEFGPNHVADEMDEQRLHDDAWYDRLDRIDMDWSGDGDEYDAELLRDHADAWQKVQQVGAQSEWDDYNDLKWVDESSDLYDELSSYKEPQKQNVITAVGDREDPHPTRGLQGVNFYRVLQMSSRPPRNRVSAHLGLPNQRNQQTLDWHREHLGHDIVGEEGGYARPFSSNNPND